MFLDRRTWRGVVLSRNARAMRSPASADSMVASKSLARHLARLIQPSVRSTGQRFGSTMKPLICLSLRWTTVTEMRLASKAARCADGLPPR